MKRLIFLSILMVISMSMLAQTFETKLIPYPEKATFSDGKHLLTRNFTISISGNGAPRIFIAVNRFLQRLDGRTGLFFNQFITPATNPSSAPFTIQVNRPGKIILNEDESYSLEITAEKIMLKAETDLGAMHGLETILQLLSNDKPTTISHSAIFKINPGLHGED